MIMNKKYIFLVLSLIGLTFTINDALAQRCDKKDYCNEEDYGDYDFRSQSHYALLGAGDTATINIVVYSGNDIRILVCADPELGAVKYSIVETKKEFKTEVKLGEEREEVEYKYDGDGNQVTDNDGNPVILRKWKTRDTTRKTIADIKDIPVFSSGGQKAFYEEKNVKKTKKLKVKLVVDQGADPEDNYCVNVLIGRKPAKDKTFYKQK